MEEKTHYIVAVGATESELVYANPVECEVYCKAKEQKAMIFTTKDVEHYKKNKSVKFTSYQLVGNVKKPIVMAVNRKNLEFLPTLKGVLERASDCLIIVDCEDNPDSVIDLIEGYRVENNLDIVLNIPTFHSFTPKLMAACTSVKIHGSQQVEFSQDECDDLIEGFGEHNGIGIFLTSLLAIAYQKAYKDYLEVEGKQCDEKMLSVPLYYDSKSICIKKEPYGNLIAGVLDQVPFIEKTAEEIAVIYNI
jgi:hypothetical protein